MFTQIKKLNLNNIFKSREESIKFTSKPEKIKYLDYLTLNIILSDLRKNGFDTEESKIADSLESLIRSEDNSGNLFFSKLLPQILKSKVFPDFEARNKFLKSTIQLFLKNKYDGIFEMCDILGIEDSSFRSDLSAFDLTYLNLDQINQFYDKGLDQVYEFSYNNIEEKISFIRKTKPVKVLSKSAFCEYLKSYFNSNSECVKGFFGVFDISKMGWANRVESMSDGKKVIYGDPYMAELIGICQVFINKGSSSFQSL